MAPLLTGRMISCASKASLEGDHGPQPARFSALTRNRALCVGNVAKKTRFNCRCGRVVCDLTNSLYFGVSFVFFCLGGHGRAKDTSKHALPLALAFTVWNELALQEPHQTAKVMANDAVTNTYTSTADDDTTRTTTTAMTTTASTTISTTITSTDKISTQYHKTKSGQKRIHSGHGSPVSQKTVAIIRRCCALLIVRVAPKNVAFRDAVNLSTGGKELQSQVQALGIEKKSTPSTEEGKNQAISSP